MGKENILRHLVFQLREKNCTQVSLHHAAPTMKTLLRLRGRGQPHCERKYSQVILSDKIFGIPKKYQQIYDEY